MEYTGSTKIVTNGGFLDRAGLISSSNRNNPAPGSKIGISAGMHIMKKPSRLGVNDSKPIFEQNKKDE